jgi:hypothetical protein
MSALSRQNLLAVAKELKQVSVAVSLVGTRRWRLLQFVNKLIPIRDALVWVRPDARKLRSVLSRVIHNMERAPENGVQAKYMAEASKAIDGIIRIVGAGVVPDDMMFGGMRIQNVWGYSASDVLIVARALETVVGRLEAAGMDVDVDFVLNPDSSPNAFASYVSSENAVFVNAGAFGSATTDILGAFGDMVWLKLFTSPQYQTWGGPAGRMKFSRAWINALDGKAVDRDTMARLTVTVGGIADSEKWEKAVA